jgi:hypothetical protein
MPDIHSLGGERRMQLATISEICRSASPDQHQANTAALSLYQLELAKNPFEPKKAMKAAGSYLEKSAGTARAKTKLLLAFQDAQHRTGVIPE